MSASLTLNDFDQLLMEPAMTPHQGMTAYAQIVAFEDGRVTLAAERKTACRSCAAAKGCSIPTLVRAFGDKPLTFETGNIAAPRVGDWYQIAMPQSTLLKLAAIAYLLPLAGLIMMAIAASLVGAGDGMSVLSGLAGLFAGHRIATKIVAAPQMSQLALPAVIGRADPDVTDRTICVSAD